MKQFTLPQKANNKGKEPAKKSQTQSRPINASVDYIVHLQQTIGNQAVQRMINSGTLQLKDNSPQPGDVYSREVDRLEKQVDNNISTPDMSYSAPRSFQNDSTIDMQSEFAAQSLPPYQLSDVNCELPYCHDSSHRPLALNDVLQMTQAASSLQSYVIQFVTFNSAKITKSDILSFLRGFGTHLAATINNDYLGKFRAKGGKHAEENFSAWVTSNLDNLEKDGQISKSKKNNIVIRITRSPCGESYADCKATLLKLKATLEKSGYPTSIKLLSLSLHKPRSSESTETLKTLHEEDVEVGGWDLQDEISKGAGEHLNVESLCKLPLEVLEKLGKRLDQLDEVIWNEIEF